MLTLFGWLFGRKATVPAEPVFVYPSSEDLGTMFQVFHARLQRGYKPMFAAGFCFLLSPQGEIEVAEVIGDAWQFVSIDTANIDPALKAEVAAKMLRFFMKQRHQELA